MSKWIWKIDGTVKKRKPNHVFFINDDTTRRWAQEMHASAQQAAADRAFFSGSVWNSSTSSTTDNSW